MSQSHHLGNTGEAKVLYELTKANFYIFTPFREDSQVDLVAIKDNHIWRIQVKSTGYMRGSAYQTSLRNSSIRRSGVVRKQFDPKSCDILAVYISPLDVICFIKTLDIKNKNVLTLRENLSNYNNQYGHRIISDFTSLSAFYK